MSDDRSDRKKVEYVPVDNLTAMIHAIIISVDAEVQESVKKLMERLREDINPYAWHAMLAIQLRELSEDQFGTPGFESRLVYIASMCIDALRRSYIARDPDRAQEAMDGETQSTVVFVKNEKEDNLE